ncbi:hypothetical protein ACFJ92_000432 [Vibrio parahaemolyticus]|nr:hypothetical protein [Vibrio parahaemolyticus]MBE3737510.1 hypothetical protein [Vibrio parahaemolyticus]HCH1220941.1 hypothetical protein [Vibrio parahaemolyticus]
MKYSDLIKNFTSYFYDKATNPFIWIFISCFILNHWDDMLVLLFSDEDIHAKIKYIESSIEKSKPVFGLTFFISTTNYTSPAFYILNPIFSAIVISIIYPYLSAFLSYMNSQADFIKNKILAFFDDKKFLSIDDSIELKEDRTRIIERFHKQVKDHQAENREMHDRLMASQMNCNALYCCLRLNEGHQHLLPFANGYNSFVAKNEMQSDLLLFVAAMFGNNASLQHSTIEKLTHSIYEHNNKESQNKDYPSLFGLGEHEIFSLLKELSDSGAIRFQGRKVSNNNEISLDTQIALTPRGNKFASTMGTLRSGGNISIADSL